MEARLLETEEELKTVRAEFLKYLREEEVINQRMKELEENARERDLLMLRFYEATASLRAVERFLLGPIYKDLLSEGYMLGRKDGFDDATQQAEGFAPGLAQQQLRWDQSALSLEAPLLSLAYRSVLRDLQVQWDYEYQRVMSALAAVCARRPPGEGA